MFQILVIFFIKGKGIKFRNLAPDKNNKLEIHILWLSSKYSLNQLGKKTVCFDIP